MTRLIWYYRFFRSWWFMRHAASFAASNCYESAYPGDEYPLKHEGRE